MAFNGTWKLESADNGVEFYKSIGMGEEGIASRTPADTPANGVTYTVNISGDTIESNLSVAGNSAFSDKSPFGNEHDVIYGKVTAKMVTKMEGDMLVETINRPGWVEIRIERTVAGDTLTAKMTSSKGVSSIRKFKKQ